MAQGVTSSITSDVSFTSKYQLTANDDTLIIRGATVTLLAPQGEIFTNEGDDDVQVEDALIITNEPNLAFYLGSGNDRLSLKNCTLTVDVSMFNGDDIVVVDGSLQTKVILNKKLTFGAGDDVLELISMLENAGSIDFGTMGTKTFRFNGGALLGTGTINSLTNLDVTLSGGTTGSNLTLSGEQTGITLNGNFFGTTDDRDVSVSGGTTTLAVLSNIRTNVRLKLNQAKLIHVEGGILEFSDHSGYAVTANESTVDLHDIVVKGGMGLTGSNTVWTVSNSDFSNSTNAVNLNGGTLDFRNGGMTNYTSTAMILNGADMTGSKVSLISNQGLGAMQITSGGIEVTDFRVNNNQKISSIIETPVSSSSGAWKVSTGKSSNYLLGSHIVYNYYYSCHVSNNCVSAFVCGGGIQQSGGNMTLTSASFSGNNAIALASALASIPIREVYYNSIFFSASAVGEVYGGAICHNNGNMSLSSATFADNNNYAQTVFSLGATEANSFNALSINAYLQASANVFGGAIYKSNGDITLTSAFFHRNVVSTLIDEFYTHQTSSRKERYKREKFFVSAYGGAICHFGGNAYLTDASFSGNIASASPLGTNSSGNGESDITACAHGGAIYYSGNNMSLDGATFFGNIASAYAYADRKDGQLTTYNAANAFASGGAICQNGGILNLTSVVFSGNIASVSASLYHGDETGYAEANACASGGAIYLVNALANMENSFFSNNIAAATGSAYAKYASSASVRASASVSACGGAICLNNTTLNYIVTPEKKLTNCGNVATAERVLIDGSTQTNYYGGGGWLYAGNQSTVNITVGNEGLLTIGDTTDKDSIGGTLDSRIAKQGAGYMLVNSDISGYTGLWTVAEGTLELARLARQINLDKWTIGTEATLVLSVLNDTINMSMNKKIGIIDMGGGSDAINTGGYDLTEGTILLSDLSLGGGGRISVKLRNRSTTEGSTLRLNDIYLDSEFTGNDYADTILINQESTLNGAIDLKNGDNVISASALARFGSTLKMGTGNDALSFTAVTFEDAVELGHGANSLTATSAAVFSGMVNAGTGADTLGFAEVTFLESADLGDGDNSLTATGTAKLKGFTTGSGVDTLRFADVTFEDSVSLGDGDNSVTATDTAKLKDLSTCAGNDTLSFADVTFEDGIDLGDGDNTLTVDGTLKMQRISGGNGTDTITLNGTSTISGEIALGGGENAIHVGYDKDGTVLTADKVKITEGGKTTFYVYLSNALANNSLTVYSDEEAARDHITLSWADQTDLDKVRILVSSDSTFDTYEFSVELYNQSKSFTLNLQQGYFIQFQAQDEDGWKQRLLDDTIAPNQVTGVKFNGRSLTWDETHDNLGGNGVKQYHVEVSDDASFTNLIASEIVTGTQYAPATLAESTLYFRVSAEDYTNNIGAWSETVSGMFDNTPPSRPSGGNSTINGYSATLSWSASTDSGSGVAQYEYRIASGSDYGQIVTSGMTEACSITVDDLKYGTYYWQVRAVDAAGNESDWSKSKNFATVDSIAPITPANLDYGIENEVSVSVIWDAVSDDTKGSGLKGYEIQLANDATFSNIVKTVSVTVAEAMIENLSNGVYYMRVCAVDNAGNKSGWTEAVNFSIDKDTTPPTVTEVKADITDPTKGNVTVTASFTDNVEVSQMLYRIGTSGAWNNYIGGVTVTDNATVYFKAVDTSGNESAEVPYVVTNIDRTPPAKPSASADITSPTNGSVMVSAMFSGDSTIRQYSTDGQTWESYTVPVIFEQNGRIYFRGTDEAGNISEVTAYTVSNIDRVAPKKPTASANITSPTNQDVTVTATFSADSVIQEYSTDGQTWKPYTETVILTENGSVSFRGVDEAGNVSKVTTYEVANIDKEPPVKPTVSADVTEITYGSVNVSAVFSTDSLNQEYSLDNGNTWQDYTVPIEFTANGTVLFRGTDAAGNISEVTSYDVTNIETVIPDTTKPSVTNVKADITSPTNQNVTVTADFADDVELAQSLYRIGETGQWQNYVKGVTVSDNTTMFFKAVDAAGNESEIKSYMVTNIDKVAPIKPTAIADITSPTNQNVTVTASFSNDSVKKEYSLDGETWQDYDEGGVIIIINGTVGFRSIDAAGNVSDVTTCEVTNIDKVAPSAPSGLMAVVSDPTVVLVWNPSTDDASGVKDYVVKYSSNGQEFTVTVNNTNHVLTGLASGSWNWSVQAIDNVGNVSMTTYGEAFTVQSAGPEKPYVARGDRNGNGVSDVMFVWEQNNCAHGYWMDGKNDWWSANAIWVSPEWDNLGNYDMSGDGKADAVMFGNVIVNDARGAYIGYYQDGDDANGWVTIGYLDNSKNIAWQNKVGNLTGNANGANSIVWYAPELYALGVWTNGTDSWVDLSHEFGGKDWTLVGCGDFNGDGKDAVLMMYSGCMFYRADIDGNVASLGSAAWNNCEVRAVGDFAGDGKDDIVLFDKNTGGMYMLMDGNSDNYKSIGQLDPGDWFIAGCGDYNGDQKDDLLVRQYSTGMLGYYSNGNQANWNVMGYGVDMDWTVIA